MELLKRNAGVSRRILLLPVDRLLPNPAQPRTRFDEAALASLAESIRLHGVLQPLTVRPTERGYELVAGERRLRAAKLAGLRTVPCLPLRADDEQSALLALVENLQRSDLHYLDQAAAISRLISGGLPREQAAEKLGLSPGALSNKLRLLRLSPACGELLRQYGLGERHARALLRLEDEQARLDALRHIGERGLSAAQSEAYVDSLLTLSRTCPPQKRPDYIVRDVRLFLNSVRRGMGVMQRSGVDVRSERADTDDEIRLLIRIPRR